MTERKGIEIDYCPTCRGVWLDRGELDKIIERSVPEQQGSPAAMDQGPQSRPQERDRNYSGHSQSYHDKPYKKKESFLGELFDW